MGPTPYTDTEQEGHSRRKTFNMEGFSIPTASIQEEWMDLADIVNNDLERDLEKKRLCDISGFDVVGFFNNNSDKSDKSFQRQPSYLDIFKEIEGEELMLGIDSVETSICVDHTSNNNNTHANAEVVATRGERTGSLTGYSHYSPASPSDSWILTEDFPEELEELQPFEMGDQLLIGEEVSTTFTLEVINKTDEASEEDMEEEGDSDEDYVPEYSKPVRRKSRAYSDTFKEDDAFEDAHKDSSDSDPDFDPEDFEEVRSTKKSLKSRKEPTSDYESEELSEEEKPQRKLVSRRSRKPSRNPIPQQRKKGSTLKISQLMVLFSKYLTFFKMPSASLEAMANLVTVSAKVESAFLASPPINMIRLERAETSSSAFLKAFSFSSRAAKALVSLSLVSSNSTSYPWIFFPKSRISHSCWSFLALASLVSASNLAMVAKS